MGLTGISSNRPSSPVLGLAALALDRNSAPMSWQPFLFALRFSNSSITFLFPHSAFACLQNFSTCLGISLEKFSMPQKGQCSLDVCETDCHPRFDVMIISEMFFLQFCLVVLQLLWFGSRHAFDNAAQRDAQRHTLFCWFLKTIMETQFLVLKLAWKNCHTKAA